MRIIIIGAGPGGYETALEAAKQDIEVTLITNDEMGGTCLNRGCIPTKTYTQAATLGEALDRKKHVVKTLRAGVEYLMMHKNITVVKGHAMFKAAKTVTVNGVDYEGDKIIIATGSKPVSLPVKGIDSDNVISSDELLELKEVPEMLSIIGGGVIGLEFASVFNKFGSEVEVLEYCNQILPRFDEEMAMQLQKALEMQGINIKTNYEVKDIEELDADKVLIAVGRKPNVEGLGLEAAGISYTAKGITVDDNMMTSVDGVYAIGDVNGKLMLAHVASFQGKRALNHILGKKDRINFSMVPSVVFTTPEVACVGMTEEMCEDDELDFRCLRSYYRANGKAVSMGETVGFAKIIVDNETDKIIGAHILGAHASIMIHEMTALMNMGATLEDAQNIIHAHPTLSEVLQSAINQ